MRPLHSCFDSLAISLVPACQPVSKLVTWQDFTVRAHILTHFETRYGLIFSRKKKVPENDWWIPLTFSYIGAMKIIQSVIDGSNYQNTCNYESIHVRIRIFDHFSRFRLSTLLILIIHGFVTDLYLYLHQ